MLRERYREWYLALADLPVWGEGVDGQVHRYVKGIQDVTSANAHWRQVITDDCCRSRDMLCFSFRTERYFGKDLDEIRRTRILGTRKVDWLAPIMLDNTHTAIEEKSLEPRCIQKEETKAVLLTRVVDV